MAAGVRRTPIGALSPDINNSFIIGVIIAKSNLKIFTSKKDGDERGVWNFTLRDSPADTINGNFWASAAGSRQYYEMFAVGDVVNIINPRIWLKQAGNPTEAFRPSVTSPFQMDIQENCSDMVPYAEEDAEEFRKLMHIPTKAPGDFLRLSDIHCYGQAMKGEFVNLLVVIRKVGDVRRVKSKKDATDILCRDIEVMDQSHQEFQITLWASDVLNRSDLWRPRETIIFFADMRLMWNTYRKCMTASISSNTVITENPNTAEANALRDYARTAPILPTAIIDQMAKNIIDPVNISSVMTTAQVLDKAYASGSANNQFTALLYAMVTRLDLDGPFSPLSSRCPKCAQFLDSSGVCVNFVCPVGSGTEMAPPEVIFNLRVNLTDHRGTLHNCRLVSPAAEKVLGCSVENFMKMSLDEKTKLKWGLLLTRCEARVLVMCTSSGRPGPLVSLLMCKPADPAEVSLKLPIY